MIHGVTIKEVADIAGPQGSIQHMLRSDEPMFTGFGEVYFSTTVPGVTKGWHVHDLQTSVLSCIKGVLTLALHDGRKGSPTHGETMSFAFGDGQRKVVAIPPGVLYAWRNDSEELAMIANCATHPHDPARSHKIPLDAPEVPKRW